MTEEMLKVEELRLNFYTYEGVVRALDGVNLVLKKGETLGVVGETGCGKSVTGLSVLVLVPPPGKIEGGKIMFNEEGKKQVNMLAENESQLRRIRGKEISMVFQDPRSALNPVYTAGDQIIEVLVHHRKRTLTKKAVEIIDKEIQADRERKKGKINPQEKTQKRAVKPVFMRNLYRHLLILWVKHPKSFSLKILAKFPLVRGYTKIVKEEAKKEAINMLRIMRIPDPERVVDMYPHELSGGMAQRVVIAMGLACNPGVLIADEPTTNLDVTVQLQILNLIKELKREFDSSIIYVTHDMGVVAEMADRVAVMYAGNVVEYADVLSTFKRPLHPYTQGLLGSIPRPGVPFKSIEGTVPSLINPPAGCRFHDRCQYAMDVCRKIKPKLTEVENEHFTQCHLYKQS
jgi:peptide/nickel transport system ATP-binding protein